MLTDLWILWGPGTTEDIGAANFLFVDGRCHLENFGPVVESDSIKKKKRRTQPVRVKPGREPGPFVCSYLPFSSLPLH